MALPSSSELLFGQGSQVPGSEGMEVRFFSLARHALASLLHVLGLEAGARILLPEYICRDLLASIHAVGAVPVFHAVDRSLGPATDPADWPAAEAVLMVDYFGFAQNLAPFEAYRRRTGALIIEDNAHGFLSLDERGYPLGSRSDAGLFSLRKTLPMTDGAAYSVRPGICRRPLPQQLDEVPVHSRAGVRLREVMLPLPMGRRVISWGAGLQRSLRRIRTGHAIPPPAPDAECVIPGSPHPHRGLAQRLSLLDRTAEARRRRELYPGLVADAVSCGATPVFPALPAGAAPYGLPLYSDDARIVGRIADRAGLDSFRWPDLPDTLAAAAPAHYRNLFLINFL